MSSGFRIATFVPHAFAVPAHEFVSLATFTTDFGPLTITGVTLTRLDDGELRVRFPSNGRGRRVILRDKHARAALLDLAVATYRAMTGREPAETPVAKASPKLDCPHDPS